MINGIEISQKFLLAYIEYFIPISHQFHIIRMKGQHELILGRFQKYSLLKKTDNKDIWLILNVSASEYYIGKFQAKSKMDKVNVKNVLHQASFLQQLQGHAGIPLMYWSGVEGIEIVVISQYLGYTLQERLQQCDGKFSPKTTCMLGIKIINNLRVLHQKGIVHRNINSTSLQFGRGLKSLDLYFNDLIDCKRYRNKKTFAHIPPKKGVKYTYQNCFGSTRFQRGQQTSRIDDIQSTIQMLIYFYTGVKPTKKGSFNLQKFPTFLRQMLQQCDNCQFEEEPNYQWFIQKLKSVLFHASYEDDNVFDWMTKPNRLDLLKVNKHIVSLKVDQDKDLLAELYDPFEQSIDIDEIATKHYNFYGENNSKMPNHPDESRKSIALEEKIKRRKAQKREKPDCVIL